MDNDDNDGDKPSSPTFKCCTKEETMWPSRVELSRAEPSRASDKNTRREEVVAEESI